MTPPKRQTPYGRYEKENNELTNWRPNEDIRPLMDERDRRYDAQFSSVTERIALIAERNALAIQAAREAVNLAMAAADKAVEKAERASEKRFESVNEFRAQMSDMQATFARTDLVNARFDMLDKKIDELSGYRASSMGRSTALSQGWGVIVSIIVAVSAVAGAVAALFFKGGSP